MLGVDSVGVTGGINNIPPVFSTSRLGDSGGFSTVQDVLNELRSQMSCQSPSSTADIPTLLKISQILKSIQSCYINNPNSEEYTNISSLTVNFQNIINTNGNWAAALGEFDKETASNSLDFDIELYPDHRTASEEFVQIMQNSNNSPDLLISLLASNIPSSKIDACTSGNPNFFSLFVANPGISQNSFIFYMVRDLKNEQSIGNYFTSDTCKSSLTNYFNSVESSLKDPLNSTTIIGLNFTLIDLRRIFDTAANYNPPINMPQDYLNKLNNLNTLCEDVNTASPPTVNQIKNAIQDFISIF